jgi:hypothetical protein
MKELPNMDIPENVVLIATTEGLTLAITDTKSGNALVGAAAEIVGAIKVGFIGSGVEF